MQKVTDTEGIEWESVMRAVDARAGGAIFARTPRSRRGERVGAAYRWVIAIRKLQAADPVDLF